MYVALRNDTPEIELPAGWLWDMVDEFVWQFQAWHQFRLRARNLSLEDVALLQSEQKAWAPGAVLRQLQQLVKKAQLSQAERSPVAKIAPDEDLDEPGSPLYVSYRYSISLMRAVAVCVWTFVSLRAAAFVFHFRGR